MTSKRCRSCCCRRPSVAQDTVFICLSCCQLAMFTHSPALVSCGSCREVSKVMVIYGKAVLGGAPSLQAGNAYENRWVVWLLPCSTCSCAGDKPGPLANWLSASNTFLLCTSPLNNPCWPPIHSTSLPLQVQGQLDLPVNACTSHVRVVRQLWCV
jgi:hypothetical protein